MADYLTFQNIYEAVERAVKDLKGARESLVKDIVNMVYLNEVMEADDLYPLFWTVRVDDSKGSVAPATVSGISKASPGVVTTAAAHGLAAGDIVSLYGVVGMVEVNNRTFKVGTVADTTHFQLLDLDSANIATTGYTTYSSGGTVHHRGITLTAALAVDRVLRAKWHDEGLMRAIGVDEVESEAGELWGDSTAEPHRFMHRKGIGASAQDDQLHWFYGADAAYDLRYWYIKRVSRLSATTDVPNLPYQFHDLLISGSIARLAESGVQVETPMLWPVIYARGIERMVAFNRRHYAQDAEANGGAPYLL